MYAANCNAQADFFAADILPLITEPVWTSAVNLA